jgi:two-component system response regulator GlrR
LLHLPNDQQLIGESPSFHATMEQIRIVAHHDASVLICGETGTGKDLCARAIHHLSLRWKKPFVPVNCGAIPVNLVENELFGHVSGAFTGASTPRTGLIHEADKGTLFLDEVVTLPLTAQVKLLRFLQEKEYRPLGSTKTLHVDVRVIAASNINIEKAVTRGTLRLDLYYRLNIVPISLLPLRKRPEDIPILARYFFAKYSAKFNKEVTGFAPDALRALTLYDWPGNVRELEHVVQRAVVLTHNRVIEPSDIVVTPLEASQREESFAVAKAAVVRKFERQYITKLLVAHGGNITQAAKAAKKNRRAFWELIRKHGIDVQKFIPSSF